MSTTAPWRDLLLVERVMLAAGVLMFVVCNCGILTAEVLPVKPRDGTLAMLSICALMLCVCRKFYCLPWLGLLVLPLARLADAALLQRYTMTEMGDHLSGVINAASPLVVFCTILAVYSTRAGKLFAIWGCASLILTIASSTFYEWLGLGHWTSIPGRMAGFHLHPNTGPTYSILCLTIVYTLNKRFWINMSLSAITILPTMLSISRSCLLMYFAVVGAYVIFNFPKHYKGLLLIIALAPTLIGAWLAAVEASATHGRLRKDEFIEGRFDAVFQGDFEGLKSAERGKDLEDGWAAVQKQPLWGYGLGCACGAVWQPHNQLVSIWLEIGFLGVVAYLIQLMVPLLACLWRRFPGGGGWCLLPAFLNIPCQQWLLEMPPYLFALAVVYGEVFPHRVTLLFREPAVSEPTPAGEPMRAF